MKNVKNNMLLLLVALIWGAAFVAQNVGMDYVGPFTFVSVRNFIGSAVLVPVIFFMDGLKRKEGKTSEEIKKERGATKTLILGGISCGTILAVASLLQQFGMLYTSVGKAGFITALYIVLVPVIGVFLGKKVRPLIFGCVGISVVGLYFLCITGEFRLGLGDCLVMLCALAFSLHILVIDHFSPLVDGVRMSAIQFLTAGILSGACMLLFEKPQISDILAAWMPILYAGALSSGAGYTLQIVAQKDADPTVASLLLSLESVFSVLAAFVILGEALSARELLGCVLMFAAIILAQMPEKKTKV